MLKLLLYILLFFMVNVSFASEETEKVNPEEKILQCAKLTIKHNENQITLARVQLALTVYVKQIDLISARVDAITYDLELAINLNDSPEIPKLLTKLYEELAQVDALSKRFVELKEKEKELITANKNMQKLIEDDSCEPDNMKYDDLAKACDKFKEELINSLNCKAAKTIEDQNKNPQNKNGPSKAHSSFLNT